MATIITIPRVKIAFSAVLAGGDPTVAPSQTTVDVGVGGVGIVPTVGAAAGNISSVYAIGPTTGGLVTSGTPLVLDMTSLTDPDGNAINFARVQGIFLENLSTTTGQIITLTGGTMNPLFADSYTAQPNLDGVSAGTVGTWQPYPGFAVSGGAKTIKITVAAGTAVPFALSIVGNTT